MLRREHRDDLAALVDGDGVDEATQVGVGLRREITDDPGRVARWDHRGSCSPTRTSGGFVELFKIGDTATTHLLAGSGAKFSAGMWRPRRTMENPITWSRPTQWTGKLTSPGVEPVMLRVGRYLRRRHREVVGQDHGGDDVDVARCRDREVDRVGRGRL